MIKSTIYTILFTAVIFTGLTLLTMKKEAASDGIDSYGYPFTFYDEFGGKCDNCYSQYGFHWSYLLADIGLVATLVFLSILFINKKLSKIRNTPPEA